jgi:hypothetical protein
MYRQMSRAQRETALLETAAHMYGALEDWYDQNPKSSSGGIEAEARRLQRELMREIRLGRRDDVDAGLLPLPRL